MESKACKRARRAKDDQCSIIMCIDGGGIRGYASLLVLYALVTAISECENRIVMEPGGPCAPYDPQDLLLSDYFDVIYGTSTGALIATMLGRLEMTVPQCLQMYREFSSQVFQRRLFVGYLPLATRYSSRKLRKAARQVVRMHCTEHASCDGSDIFAKNTNRCQTICLTAIHGDGSRDPYLLRTHSWVPAARAPRYNPESSRISIVDAMSVASAAPFFFKPANILMNGRHIICKDGGIRANNPALVAWSELSRHSENPTLLLSLGTGRSERTRDGFCDTPRDDWIGDQLEKLAVLKDVRKSYTDTQGVHRTMLAIARGTDSWYKRLDPSFGIGDLRLDEWERGLWTDPAGQEREVPGGKTLSKIEQGIRRYLDQDLVKKDISRIAEILVSNRRTRSQDERPQ